MRYGVPVFIANAFVLRKSAPFAVLRARAVVMLRARGASGVSVLLQLLRGKSIIGNYGLISCGAVPDSALLLNITAHYGYSRCLGSFPFLGTGLKVTPCGTLPPPHSRPVASHMGRRLSPTTAPKLLPSFRSSFGLRLSACRLTVSTLRHTEVSRRGVPPRSAERTAKPTAESCDICAIVTTSSL